MSAPQQPSRRENEPVEAVPPQHQLDPVSGPDGDSSDQDIDTAGTEADEEKVAPGPDLHDAPPPAGRPAIDRHR
jgi:hypothetical protein